MLHLKGRKIQLSLFSLIAIMFMSLTLALAQTQNVFAVDEQQAHNNLTTYVQSQMTGNEYPLEGGGTLDGEDLFVDEKDQGYDLDEDEFNRLTSKGKEQVVSDIATYSNEAVEDDSVKGVSESTVQNWWKQLQTKKGVGSKFMNELLKNTKPDFVTANAIYQPFSGLVGTIMGVMAVLLIAALGLVMTADICYIVLPPVRALVADKDGNSKSKTSKIFSHAAIRSVEIAENSGDGQSEGKQALGIYLKQRVVALIILGICLVYLVNGQIYTLVGWILDLVQGFLGF